MRVLVIGGAGYIGSHAARQLSRSGYDVAVFDNLSTGHAVLAHGFELVVGDLRDGDKLAWALRGVDAVMHFAAHTYVEESVKSPRKYFDNNVRAGLTLLNTLLEARIPCLIFSSTCAVYGVPLTIPIKEDASREPISPYGASKLFFEHALEAYGKAYGLRFVSLRYFNAAGADESGEIGELHNPETHLIPRVLRVAAGLDTELRIYGNDYPTPDGTCLRDYVHVNDIAGAHVLALKYLVANGGSVALNLGTGTGHSVKEVVSMVETVTGRIVQKQYCGRRPGDPPVLVADASRAQHLLHWTPLRSLEEIVSSAWKWVQCSQNLISKQGASSGRSAQG